MLSVLRVFNFPNLKAEALAICLAKCIALQNRRTGKRNSLKSWRKITFALSQGLRVVDRVVGSWAGS